MAPGILASTSSSDAQAIKGVAGMYDCYQEGKGQDPAAVAAGKNVTKLLPNCRAWAYEKRATVNRAVRLLARNGITQVADLGSGKPSPHGKSTHEAVLMVSPKASVLYVEIKGTAVVEGKRMIEESGWGERMLWSQH